MQKLDKNRNLWWNYSTETYDVCHWNILYQRDFGVTRVFPQKFKEQWDAEWVCEALRQNETDSYMEYYVERSDA